VYKPFTAGDLVSRWAYSSLHSRATANLARVSLEELRKVKKRYWRALMLWGI